MGVRLLYGLYTVLILLILNFYLILLQLLLKSGQEYPNDTTSSPQRYPSYTPWGIAGVSLRYVSGSPAV